MFQYIARILLVWWQAARRFCVPHDHDVMPSWERRHEIGLAPAWLRTVIEVGVAPSETFQELPEEEDYAGPLIYALVTGMIGMFAFVSCQAWHIASLPLSDAEHLLNIAVRVFALTVAPLFQVLNVVLPAGACHLSLVLMHGARHRRAVTFRVICYSYGTALLFLLYPPVGILYLVSGIIGIRRVHKTSLAQNMIAQTVGITCLCGCLYVQHVLVRWLFVYVSTRSQLFRSLMSYTM